YVIEDDYDSEYRYDISPVPPLHSLKAGRNVVYLGTISKTLSPMMRIGYLVVPEELQDVCATAKRKLMGGGDIGQPGSQSLQKFGLQ
ncbi:hypothetical protein ACC734_38480, partial [Rhizobium ruizarguesonis]